MVTLFPALTLLVASLIGVGVTYDVRQAAKKDAVQDLVPPSTSAQPEKNKSQETPPVADQEAAQWEK
ncbi:hypothetical protein [Chitinimonas lacunae]|uniref:Secreted protein n=1 Tax=Chitinimonas lacunae TaxID=1963018 RepID=A0ABV8MQC7_9NEIS